MKLMSIIQSSNGGLSLSRTQAALGFLVVTGIIIYQAYKGTLDNTVLLTYFGFCITGYAAVKKIATDKDIKEQQIDAEVKQ